MAHNKYDSFFSFLQELFLHNRGMKDFLEAVLKSGMAEEVRRHLRADRHERSKWRRGHRNGTKRRTLNTRVGRLELDVPQVRGCEPYHPSMFNRWQRGGVRGAGSGKGLIRGRARPLTSPKHRWQFTEILLQTSTRAKRSGSGSKTIPDFSFILRPCTARG